MHDHLSRPAFEIVLTALVGVVPSAGLVVDVVPELVGGEDHLEGHLAFVFGFGELRDVVRDAEDFDQHAHAPLVDAQEEDAAVEAGVVVGAEEVDVVEVLGREEDFEGDVGVQEDDVGSEPPGVICQ